ncbi:MAG: rhodanese-like domain-containing protein [Saprospiraceae bacterium]|nr:rhodanese-like domain-containing protein [Saprospiraceae bacterium]NNK90750.1 rhodanese-like domain-containing protein [Saprospiraceae bacterium]
MKIYSLSILICLTLATCKTKNNQAGSQTTGDQQADEYPVQKVADGIISLEKGMEYFKTGEYIFVDLRTPEEIEEFGMIEGSIVLDMKNMSFKTKLNELDRDKKYVLYCRAGNRSARAYKMTQGMGFKTVYDLTDGFDGWMDMENVNN